jgi:hypothetical protein
VPITKPLPQPSRVVPLTLVSVGGAGLVTGGVLIYLGQQDGANDKTVHRRATALGVAAGIAGIAALGAGVYLWRRDSALTIATVPGGGAVVGWTRTF